MNINTLHTKSDDDEIIESFLSGNKNAFNILVRKYQERIYWVIRKMVLDHDDADDITQELFLKVHKSLKDFRGESKFFTYMYRIAINLSLNHLAKTKKNNSRSVNFENTNVSSLDLNADEAMDANEKTKLLEEAIESLPVQQRAVFNMRYYENLSYDEISAIMGKSTGGMKANYFHAIKNIEKYLKKNRLFEVMEQF
ncbi:MAG TPA: sigma-70 family RNA polymerase sigma factor [Ignavibacteria bacterium]|nr:sigma-70 family RNA polymerase sigma factor [Ignavibacteria bacterium]